MDPFGDDTSVENGVSMAISDFVPPSNTSGDFYEVEPTENTRTETYEDHFQHMEESYEPMDFGVQIPVVEEENELTYARKTGYDLMIRMKLINYLLFLLPDRKFMQEYEKQIALKAQEQEKVADECKVKAEDDMAQFVAERQRIKESKMQSNRVFEQAAIEKMVADLQNENPWERVVTLVDLETSRKKKLEALSKKDSEKQDPQPVAVPAKKTPEDEEDVSRMRQLFVQLKATPLEQTRANAVAAN
ncbi:hypothetical protein KXD40_006443 [Peronospora effusa]|uniref:Clathrin light chain n=1 Tax=Peronospora effusa TaxID=542832 RepID=A0A425CJ19_9STRA|nr:hypothetical protein DD237_002072 [Peronospora effusa]UIZ25864.1 hypothetical protein KXD40_006443 [Peronospora effusa]